MALNYYSQRNPAWANAKIGSTTLGKEGCTVTSSANVAGWYGLVNNPSWWASNLKFTAEGKILWGSFNLLPIPFKFEWRHYEGAGLIPAIKEALKNPKKVVIVEIRHSHWVAGTSFLLNVLTAIDPWTLPTARKTFYGSGYITGCAVFVKK
jgi:hypothetical protein